MIKRLLLSGFRNFSRKVRDTQDYGQFVNAKPDQYFHHEQEENFFQAYRPEERDDTKLMREPFPHQVYYPDTRQKVDKIEDLQNFLHGKRLYREQELFEKQFKLQNRRVEMRMNLLQIQKDRKLTPLKQKFKKLFKSQESDIRSRKTDYDRPVNATLMDKLVDQLGYLDFRDLLAAYRYVLEANRHENAKVNTRAELLSYALKKMKHQKLERIIKRVENPSSEPVSEELEKFIKQMGISRGDNELRSLLEQDELRQVYREIYNTNRAEEAKEKQFFEDSYQRLEELDQRRRLQGEYLVEDPQDKDLMKKWTKDMSYSEKRRIAPDSDSDISDEQFAEVWREWRKLKDFEIEIGEKSDIEFIDGVRILDDDDQLPEGGKLFQEQQGRFHNKKESQVIRGRDRITFELEQQMLTLRRLYAETRLKREDVVKDEPFFSGAEEAGQFGKRLKNNYYDAKFRFHCSKALRKYDRLLGHQKVVYEDKQDPFVHEKDSMTYMFQDLDWNSDRSFVRDAILRDKAKRISLKDIGRTLDQFLIQDKAKNKVNILASEEDGPPEAATRKVKGRDFYWTENLMNHYETKRPLFLEAEADNLLLQMDPEQRKIYEEARGAQPDTNELTQDEKYEIELFHAFKKDPYFQHYVKYNVIEREERMKEVVADLPLFIKGVRLNDFLKFHDYPKLDFTSRLADSSYKRAVVDGKAWGSGKRKSCLGFAYVQEGNGKMMINGKNWIKHFPTGITFRNKILHAIYITGLQAQIDVHMRVIGGGLTGQHQALAVAVARALANYMPPARKSLKMAGYLKTDPRKVESKKPGKYKARKSHVYQRR